MSIEQQSQEKQNSTDHHISETGGEHRTANLRKTKEHRTAQPIEAEQHRPSYLRDGRGAQNSKSKRNKGA